MEREYVSGLEGLAGFSYIEVLWWFSDCDNESARAMLYFEQPYKKAPAIMGTFATRAPARPNPIALTAAEIIDIDNESGCIRLAYIDANDGSPVLDIKPYHRALTVSKRLKCRRGAASDHEALKPPAISIGKVYSISKDNSENSYYFNNSSCFCYY